MHFFSLFNLISMAKMIIFYNFTMNFLPVVTGGAGEGRVPLRGGGCPRGGVLPPHQQPRHVPGLHAPALRCAGEQQRSGTAAAQRRCVQFLESVSKDYFLEINEEKKYLFQTLFFDFQKIIF